MKLCYVGIANHVTRWYDRQDNFALENNNLKWCTRQLDYDIDYKSIKTFYSDFLAMSLHVKANKNTVNTMY